MCYHIITIQKPNTPEGKKNKYSDYYITYSHESAMELHLEGLKRIGFNKEWIESVTIEEYPKP